MHPHSLTAHKETRQSLDRRSREIYEHMVARGEALTDRQIKNELAYADMNNVRPRITELIHAGYAVEIGETKCEVTGKTVRLVKAITERQGELFNG